jgi:hypothetical protein
MSRIWLLALFVGLAGCAETHSARDRQSTQASELPQFGGNQFARDHSMVPTGPTASLNQQ